MQALRTAATGMAAQQLNVEVISNNIANMNTVGFKRQSAVFEDLLYQTLEQPGAQSSDQGNIVPSGVQIGADGYLVQPTITVPQNTTNITISQTGQVQATVGGQQTPTIVGQLQLATFLNDAGLEAVGNNLFTESAASGPATAGNPGNPGYGVVMQGYTEASNVDPVSEITNLIIAQRAYEMNSKVVTTADQMLSTAVNTKS